MSIETGMQRLLELVDAKGSVTTDDLTDDFALTAESTEDLNAAADLLEANGRVIVFRETGAPPGLSFTGMTRSRI
jgi:hypothetical protein